MKQQVVLIIMDGWGYRTNPRHNAIAQAKTPNYDLLWKNYPHTTLKASGEAIGLPEGQMGTSEANHLIIGSGRILYQNLLKINRAVKNDDLKNNSAIKEAFNHVKKHNSVLHVKGLASPGGVHSHMDHIKYIVKAAHDSGVKNIMLHLYTDGRDTLPQSAIEYIRDLETYLKTLGAGKIASLGGRYWGMDRDNNADRVEKHFRVMVVGDGPRFKNAIEIIEDAYKKGITDEYIEPSLVEIDDKGELGCIATNDAVIFSNFRADRAKQITRRFIKEGIKNLKFVSMVKYADDIDISVAFPKDKVTNTLSEVLSRNKIKQLRVTETEKYTHLTFFFNAQKDKPDQYEDRIMIPSRKDIRTHDKAPEMKAAEIADIICKDLSNRTHDFIVANLVNCDIVGHTCNVPSIIKAVETVDKTLGRIYETAEKTNATIIITADHGNAEENYDEINKQPLSSHTLNPVPFILVNKKIKKINHKEGLLSDIAPTILKIFNLPVPNEMTGKSFI